MKLAYFAIPFATFLECTLASTFSKRQFRDSISKGDFAAALKSCKQHRLLCFEEIERLANTKHVDLVTDFIKQAGIYDIDILNALLEKGPKRQCESDA